MSELAFFDTNVLLYADDGSDPRKRDRATTLFSDCLRSETVVLSLQVLQEYYVAATRKLGVAENVAQQKVEIFSRCKMVRFQATDVIAGIELHRLHRLSLWDALIVHAARVAGARILYSEDLATGATIAGVKVVNPFLLRS